MNHRIAEFARYAEAAIKGIESVDRITDNREAYHLEVVKEHKRVMEEALINLSERLDVPLDLSHLEVTSSNDIDNEIRISCTHKIFADLSEETKHKRIDFSRQFGKATGIYFPVEPQTVKRVILEIELKK